MPKQPSDDELRERFLSSMDDAQRWRFVSKQTNRGVIHQIVSLIAHYCDEDLNEKIDQLRKRHERASR